MGVDAIMYVKTLRDVDDDVIRSLSRQICGAVGHSAFNIDRPNEWLSSSGTHALSMSDGSHWMPDDGIPGTIVCVNLALRYYGRGYERGHLPTLLAIVEWLQINMEPCTVYYGGDNVETIRPFTIGDRLELVQHWAGRNGADYFDSGWPREDRIKAPTCDLCLVPMVRRGTMHWSCLCGLSVDSDDGGKTFTTNHCGSKRAWPFVLREHR